MTEKKDERTKNGSTESAKNDGRAVDFHVVGIGASAGGLHAFETFFKHVPSDSGLAFVLVQHLRSGHKSSLPKLIQNHTEIPVSQIEDEMTIEPDHIYVIPPGKDLALMHGELHLLDPPHDDGPRLPIDHFFRSLAQDRQERAICVVLSGTGSDGTLGVRAVKEAGGMAMAQNPETAEYAGMPRSAVNTGLVDYILPLEEMGQQLVAYVDHTAGSGEKKVSVPKGESPDLLRKVLVILRDHIGHDFSSYKKGTIHRRLERRMAVNQIAELDHYIRYLRRNPEEIEALFREFLITVTNFFRDPEAFAALEEQVIPRLLDRPTDESIRVWVPGCATGEEAYSIAILLKEQMEEMKKRFQVQVFATDIDSEAIETARTGVYPDGIAADVSAERLARYFTKQDGAYKVNSTIRDMLVFAEQNVVGDPPFSRIDLISCRNLLIYMEGDLQKKVIPLFHYSLRSGGFLFLGTSESVGEFTDLFEPVDQKHKIYRRKDTVSANRPPIGFSPSPRMADVEVPGPAETDQRGRTPHFRQAVEESLLKHYAPSCAIIDESGEVHYFHGRTGKYLEPATGKATHNILRMARPGLKLELATAVRKALDLEEPVRYPGLRVQTNGEIQPIDLTVRPVKDQPGMDGLLMVVFEDVEPEEEVIVEENGEPIEDRDRRIADLERELRKKEEYLQTTVEELETSNEELKSTNEELQSANEELQSTIEELETAKEEAQSINEELTTVNTELEQKVEELRQTNNDMENMLAGTGVGSLFLDTELRIERFTPAVAEVMNLIDGDVGRPVGHITSNFVDYDTLEEDAEEVLDTLESQEKEVRTKEGDWYQIRIKPYRTLRNAIEGVVITFVDISELKEAKRDRDYAQSIVKTVREPLLILDADLHVVSANRSFYETFHVAPEETEGTLLYHLGNKQWDIPELRELLEEILPQETTFNDYEVEHDFPEIGRRRMILNAREVHRAVDKDRLILLAIEDVTED